MIWILYIVGSLAALVVIMAIIGATLPREHVAARRAKLAKPASDVWLALSDLDGQTSWRKGLRKVEHLDARDGKPCFREITAQGVITYVIDEDRAPTSSAPGIRITRIADERLPFGGRWIYELASSDGTAPDSTLTITEDGFVKNPVFRFLSKTVFSQSATLEHFLRNLGTHLGVEARPEPAEPSALARR
ncbi:MAG TPA: hypothetical protein VIV11_06295 [Kofleriaceae bacterium]